MKLEKYQYIEDFRKYARFISEHFDVKIEFDGLKAQTNGRVITLPRLETLTESEIDFLYCILLHEVGHVRYTDFSKENFAKVKSDNHFLLVNSLEDARIENLLMKDFEGAKDYFHDLYNKFVLDKNFVKKIFGGDNFKHMSEWQAIANYCHHYLIELPNKEPFSKLIGSKLDSKVRAFIDENGIENLLKYSHLRNWNDVISLSNKIYDLYFHNKKDTSDINNIKEEEKILKKTAKKLSSFKEELEKIEEKIEKLEEQKREIWNANKEEWQAIRDKVKNTKKEIKNNKKVFKDLNKQIKNYHRVNKKTGKLEEKIPEQHAIIDRTEKKIEEYKERIKNLESEIAEKKKLGKKTKSLENELAKTENSLKKQNNLLQERRKKLQELENELDRYEKVKENLESSKDDGSIKEMSDKLKELEDKKAEADKIQQELQKSEYKKKYDSLDEEIKKLKKEIAKKAIEKIKAAHEEMSDSEHRESVIPSLDPVPGWEEASTAQQQFDTEASEKSGQIVVNGCGLFGTNVREIISYLNKTLDDIQSIDLMEHFKIKHKISKFDDFNELDTKLNNTQEFNSGRKPSKDIRRMIPMTKEFDKTINKLTSDGSELSSIRSEHRDLIARLKNLFKTKLKFSKKQWYKGNQDEGSLDSRSLWKLATKDSDNIYEINNPKPVNKVSASVLVDISGSMDKSYTEHGKRLKELTLFLSDALSEVHIKHEILGYHAPVNTEMRNSNSSGIGVSRTANNLETVVYKNFNDRRNIGIQNLELEVSDNSDSESLMIAARRLLKSQGKYKILFMIADFKPFLNDTPPDVMDNALNEAIKFCRMSGIKLFGLGFNKHGFDFLGEDFCFIEDGDYSHLLKFIERKM